MRKFFLLTAVATASCVMLMADRAGADEPKDAKAAQAVKDPNYRWHNGQWWYWVPKEKNWMVWNGNAWTKYDQASRGAARSFSYQPGDQSNSQGVQRMFGTPLWSSPDSVSNQRIIGSYGFHSAGSKAMGNY